MSTYLIKPTYFFFIAGGIKHFLNSYEGIYFSLSKKFINVFVDKIHYIDPVNLSSITINTDFIVIDFCFNENHKILLVLG